MSKPTRPVLNLDFIIITTDRWQSKTLLTIDKHILKLLETVFAIAICRQSGYKWQWKTLFLTIFDLPFIDIINVFYCRLSGVIIYVISTNISLSGPCHFLIIPVRAQIFAMFNTFLHCPNICSEPVINKYYFIFSYNLTVHQARELWNMMPFLSSIDVLL